MDRVWYGDIDVATTDSSSVANAGKNTLWVIKQLLIGVLSGTNAGTPPPAGSRWSVVGSSDAVTAGMDTTDRWGQVFFDASKMVRVAAAGTPHSWIVLKSPDALGPIYLVLDYVAGTDNAYSVTGTKVLPTGGTTSTAPTTVQSWTHAPMGFGLAAAQIHKVHRITDANGAFYLVITTGGTAVASLICVDLEDARSTDAHKVVTYAGSGALALTLSNLSNTTLGANAHTFKSRTINNSVQAEFGLMVPGFVSGSQFVFSSLMTGADNIDSRFSRLPAYLFQVNATNYGIRGRLPDALLGGILTPQASTSAPSGTIEQVYVGNLWLPWINAAPSF